MISHREDFGIMIIQASSWESKKQIQLCFKEENTPQQMVAYAIAVAKRYNCTITKPLEYIEDDGIAGGGKFLFEVKCHAFTYHYFYDGGITQHTNGESVSEKDVARYRATFGTDRCLHRTFKKKYWYTDNWTGRVHTFPTMKAAKAAAATETGSSVWLYTNFPYGRPSHLIGRVDASGITPP